MLLYETETAVRRLNVDIIKRLGKGKGGYSYLAKSENGYVVLKQMHYEPNETYDFESNKLQSELRDYGILKKIGISMPELIYSSDERQFLIKEYIDGQTIAEIVAQGKLKDEYVVQMLDMCKRLYAAGLNIDYFPPNFVVGNGHLYYVDYECNHYMEEWSFEQWGVYFWANTDGMKKFLETGEHKYLSKDAKPHKTGLEDIVSRLLKLGKNNV